MDATVFRRAERTRRRRLSTITGSCYAPDEHKVRGDGGPLTHVPRPSPPTRAIPNGPSSSAKGRAVRPALRGGARESASSRYSS